MGSTNLQQILGSNLSIRVFFISVGFTAHCTVLTLTDTHLTRRFAAPGLAAELDLVAGDQLAAGRGPEDDDGRLGRHEDGDGGVSRADRRHAALVGRAHLALEPRVVLQAHRVYVERVVS